MPKLTRIEAVIVNGLLWKLSPRNNDIDDLDREQALQEIVDAIDNKHLESVIQLMPYHRVYDTMKKKVHERLFSENRNN